MAYQGEGIQVTHSMKIRIGERQWSNIGKGYELEDFYLCCVLVQNKPYIPLPNP